MVDLSLLPGRWPERLLALREQFMVLDDRVAGLDEAALLRSWRRCLGAGPDRRAVARLPRVGQGASVGAVEQRVIGRVTALIGASIDAAGAVAIATDMAGTVIHTAGRPESLPPFWRALFEPGTSMAEPVLGTSAPTLASIERRPQTVIRDAHFWRPMEPFYCTAVPLPDPRGGWLGALDISGFESLPDIDALCLLRLGAALIEDEVLRETAPSGVIELMPPVALGGVGRAGLIAVDADGRARALNSVARGWLRAGLVDRLPVPLTLLLGSGAGHIERSPWRHTMRPVELQMPTGWMAMMEYLPPGNPLAGWPAGPASKPESTQECRPAPGPPAPCPPPLSRARVDAVRQALAACGGNVSEAARRLGISRNSIYRWLADKTRPPATG